jgi:hypothetical protein
MTIGSSAMPACNQEAIEPDSVSPIKQIGGREAADCNSEIVSFGRADQRFENWNERRALARPYFLRSTTRGSRVRNPPRFKTLRRSGSK